MQGELGAIRFEIWYALMERTGRKKEIAHLLSKPPHPSPQPSPLRGERESALHSLSGGSNGRTTR
jgi:hypothetical protein